MKDDVLSIEILADGTIKTTTDPISPANHASAENFLAEVTRLSGGEATRSRRKGAAHVHSHGTVTHKH